MSSAQIARLADRGVVRVAGADAEKLLQGIITNDMGLLASQPAMHAALLTPQGKILFEFFVVRDGPDFLLEVERNMAAALAKRLTLYKLRAKVEIQDVSSDYSVLALWGDYSPSPGTTVGRIAFADPRQRRLGWRIIARREPVGDVADPKSAIEATANDYDAHRISLGVPESGKDYALGDTFPHEADLDQLGGVSFTKGCFVGQEVVSRMHNRASVRKRIVPVDGEAPLRPGADIKAGDASIGSIGSVAGTRALALVRLDRAKEALDKGETLTADGIALTLRDRDLGSAEAP
jgi:tRNA-modifying protein YgfZ